MKIEVGKFYKTWAGKKVRIYAVDGDNNECIHGAILTSVGWRVYSWFIDGTFISASMRDNLDIVSEWIEKKPRQLAYIYPAPAKGLSPIYWPENEDSRDATKGMIRAPWLDEPAERSEAL